MFLDYLRPVNGTFVSSEGQSLQCIRYVVQSSDTVSHKETSRASEQQAVTTHPTYLDSHGDGALPGGVTADEAASVDENGTIDARLLLQ